MAQINNLVLDIHIPFVSEKLHFSPEYQLTGDHAARMSYLAALEAEAQAVAPDITGEVKAIRISGPAPSIMSPDGLSYLLKQLHTHFTVSPQCEISIAALPHTVGTPSLTGWNAGGINRISLLADTLHPAELAALSRPFDVDQIQNALLFLDKFHRQNVDVALSLGIPGQTEITLMQNLRSLNQIDTPHITLKPIQVVGEGVLDPGQQKALYQKATERLESYGYHQYAPGCFTKEHRWQSSYAQALAEGAQLVGLGLGAQSCYNNIAYTNTKDFATYTQHPDDAEKTVAEVFAVDDALAQSTFVANQLRYSNGFSRESLVQQFGSINPVVEEQLQALETEGLLTCEDCEDGHHQLTPDGQFRQLFV